MPKRYFRICVEKLQEQGTKENGKIELHNYEHQGHGVSAAVNQDTCSWLEKVIPANDAF